MIACNTRFRSQLHLPLFLPFPNCPDFIPCSCSWRKANAFSYYSTLSFSLNSSNKKCVFPQLKSCPLSFMFYLFLQLSLLSPFTIWIIISTLNKAARRHDKFSIPTSYCCPFEIAVHLNKNILIVLLSQLASAWKNSPWSIRMSQSIQKQSNDVLQLHMQLKKTSKINKHNVLI